MTQLKGLSGNARQRRAIVRRWKKTGLTVRNFGGGGQFVMTTKGHADYPCRNDGRCQYAIDSGAEGLGHCPRGKCVMTTKE